MSKENGILYLPIKIKWLDMIAENIKKEDYREIKPYWTKILTINGVDFVDYHTVILHVYGRVQPVFADVVGIRIGKGKPEWGAPKEDVYIIKIDDAGKDLPF